MISTEENEAAITADREKFRPLAIRGAILYFVIASLNEIDPMYQFSLNYFLAIFCTVISAEDTPADTELSIRLENLLAAQIYAFYLNISRGLFERHNLIFSFMLTIATEKQEKRVTDTEIQYLLRGPSGQEKLKKLKLDGLNMSDYMWKCCLYLQQEFSSFQGLSQDLLNNIHIQIGDYSNVCVLISSSVVVFSNCSNHFQTFTFSEKDARKVETWNQKLNLIQKLMLVYTFAPDQMVLGITAYVKEVLGKNFTEAMPCTLSDL